MGEHLVNIQMVEGYQGMRTTIFSVSLPDRPPVYMSVKSTSLDDETGIVIVDAQKFLDLWKNTPGNHRELAHGNRQTWMSDNKYPDAEVVFSRGISRPVSLAEISFSTLPNSEKPYVSIVNGVTRTIWLLANVCGAFPVECQIDENAEKLHHIASVSGIPFLTLGKLLKNPEKYQNVRRFI